MNNKTYMYVHKDRPYAAGIILDTGAVEYCMCTPYHLNNIKPFISVVDDKEGTYLGDTNFHYFEIDNDYESLEKYVELAYSSETYENLKRSYSCLDNFYKILREYYNIKVINNE